MSASSTTEGDDSEIPVDYDVYLITNSCPAVLRGRDLVSVVKEALEGGVTIVQYSEKSLEAEAMVEQAKKLKELCHEHEAKLIIDDRVDVAFAADADGVHLGRNGFSIKSARNVLRKDAIVGISCSTKNEALKAVQDGADYLIIGAVYTLSNKTDAYNVIGISGVREIVSAVGRFYRDNAVSNYASCVAIGGLNATNIQHVEYKCSLIDGYLDGVAIGNPIMGAESPERAAQELCQLAYSIPPWHTTLSISSRSYSSKAEELVVRVGSIARRMVEVNPVSHNMTNIVAANFTANVAIAAGASPIMSKASEEAADLAKLGGGLVINIGSATPADLPIFISGMQAYNKAGAPVLLDPVGIGATQMRNNMVSELMNNGYIDIIKGNENELRALASSSNPAEIKWTNEGELEAHEKARLVATLAEREACTVLMTGATDYLSDGLRTYAISNGVASLGNIASSGCALGALIVAFVAVHKEDKLLATLAAVLFYEIAAELAQENEMCQGPGNFVPCFLDALRQVSGLCKEGNDDWLVRALVQEVQVDGFA